MASPERPAHGQGDGGLDARARPGDHGPPHDLPPGPAEGEGRFTVRHRHALERGAGECGQGRQHHHRQNHRGQEDPRSEILTAEEVLYQRDLLQKGFDVALEEGDEDEQAPQPDDDARDRRQQVDAGRQRPGDTAGQELGQGSGGGDAHGDGEEEPYRGGEQGVDDEDPGAELLGVGVPRPAEDETQPRVPERRGGLPDQAHHQRHDDGGEDQDAAPLQYGVDAALRASAFPGDQRSDVARPPGRR